MALKLLYIALAGSVGTLTRYGLAGLAQRLFGAAFPWGTVTVNLTGCLLAGAFWSVADQRLTINPDLRTAVMIGFFGALTTFSTFILETNMLVRDSQYLWALGNVALQVIAGLTCVVVGIALGRLV